MKRALVPLFLVAAAAVSAQDWVACFNSGPFSDDDARAVATDPQGFSYVVGFTHGITAIKYAPTGDTVWTRTHVDSGYEEYGAMAVNLDRFGDIVVAAAIYKPPSNGFSLLKYHPNGMLVWDTVQWNSQASQGAQGPPLRMVTDQHGSIYLAGSAVNDTTVTDIVVCKFDAAGNPRWTRTFDGPRHDADQAEALSLRGDTELFVAGMTTDASNRYNATVLRYDTAGTLRWTYAYQPNTDLKSWAKDLGVCSDGSSYIVGWRQNVSGASRVCLSLRLDHDGDTTWSRTDSSEGDALATDGNDNLFAVGQVNRSIGYTARIWKYDPSGDMSLV